MPTAIASTTEDNKEAGKTSVLQIRGECELLQDIKVTKEQEWRAGFEAMGHDTDTNNIEYAMPAMREALFGE